jgi:stress response protein YsnF
MKCSIRYLKEEMVISKPKSQVTKRVSPKPPEDKEQAILMPADETVVSPDLPKTTVTIIRPASMEKEDSFTGRATDLMESMKDKTEDAIDSIKSATGMGVSRIESNIDEQPLVIPIIEQKSTTETKGYTETISIGKKQVERKKNIELKVKYDEIFVNGKEIHTSAGDTLREIRDKILEIVSFDQDRDEKELEKGKGQMIPLLGNNTEMEKVIPLYAEEIVISKRMVKIADIIIHKRIVSETTKVNVDLITEQIIIQNPTGGSSPSEDDG